MANRSTKKNAGISGTAAEKIARRATLTRDALEEVVHPHDFQPKHTKTPKMTAQKWRLYKRNQMRHMEALEPVEQKWQRQLNVEQQQPKQNTKPPNLRGPWEKQQQQHIGQPHHELSPEAQY